MMFMVSGRATNPNGSPIVRDGLVAALHAAGHSVTTAQPRRGSYSYVDYLVATQESINRRVTKVRWAADRGIRVINYAQMWRLIRDGVEPQVQALPANMEPVPRRVPRQSLDTVVQNLVPRPIPTPEPDRLRDLGLMHDTTEQGIADHNRRAAADLQAIQEAEAEARANAPPIVVIQDPPLEPAKPIKPRRRIVTRR